MLALETKTDKNYHILNYILYSGLEQKHDLHKQRFLNGSWLGQDRCMVLDRNLGLEKSTTFTLKFFLNLNQVFLTCSFASISLNEP